MRDGKWLLPGNHSGVSHDNSRETGPVRLTSREIATRLKTV